MTNYVGVRHVRDFLLGGAATYGTLWLGVESVSAFFDSLKPEGAVLYSVFLFLSVLGGVWRAYPTRRIEIPVPGSDSSLEIRSGDVFDGDGVIVIPVNEYFDGELGDHVSEIACTGGSLGMFSLDNPRRSST